MRLEIIMLIDLFIGSQDLAAVVTLFQLSTVTYIKCR